MLTPSAFPALRVDFAPLIKGGSERREAGAADFWVVLGLIACAALVAAAHTVDPHHSLVVSRPCLPLVEGCELPDLRSDRAGAGFVVVASVVAPGLVGLLALRRHRRRGELPGAAFEFFSDAKVEEPIYLRLR